MKRLLLLLSCFMFFNQLIGKKADRFTKNFTKEINGNPYACFGEVDNYCCFGWGCHSSSGNDLTACPLGEVSQKPPQEAAKLCYESWVM